MTDETFDPRPPEQQLGGGPLFGKYRGKVLDNFDPLDLGRLLVEVPQVPGMLLNWAMPSVPYAGPDVGFYAMPPIGANVWVEFERGNPTYPIWAGCFWEEGEVPALPPDPLVKVWKTMNLTLKLDDTPETGGLTIEARPPSVDDLITLRFSAAGVSLTIPESALTMTPETIVLTVPESALTMTAETLVLTVPESIVTLTAELIEITVPPATLSLAAEVIAVGLPPTAVTLSEEGMIIDSPLIEVAAADLNITGDITAEGDTNMIGSLQIEGSTAAIGDLLITGASNFLGVVAVEGDVNILGGLQVEGNEAVAGVIEGVIVPPF